LKGLAAYGGKQDIYIFFTHNIGQDSQIVAFFCQGYEIKIQGLGGCKYAQSGISRIIFYSSGNSQVVYSSRV